VLTGGSSGDEGAWSKLGEEIFHMPVAGGAPSYMGGSADVVRNPRYRHGGRPLARGRDQFIRQQQAEQGFQE
jgi:cell division protein FtsA